MGTSGHMSTTNQYIKYTITINQNWQDIASNFSNVTVSVRFFRTNTGYTTYGNGTVWCRINGNIYSAGITTSQKITNAGIELFNLNLNIGHNSDGSKYLETSSWFSLPTVSSGEQGYGEWLSTIPRNATCTDATNFNDEQNPTIYFNNPGNFELYLKMEAGGNDFLITRDRATRSSPYTFYLSESERNLLREKCQNSNQLGVRFTVGTYINGSVVNWSYADRTMNIVNAAPNFGSSNISYQDTKLSVVAITENNQNIVRNQSTLSVSFTSATAKKYASISKYQLSFNGATTERTSSGTVSYGTVNSGNNLTLNIKAIDSRGNSTSSSKTIKMLDWQLPTAIINAKRENNYEDQTNLKIKANISSVNSKNTLQELKYRYKKTSESSFSSYVTVENGAAYTIEINKLFAWNFQFVITDKFGSSTYNLVIPKGTPILFFDSEKISVGINKFPVNENSLDVDFLNGKPVINYDIISAWDDPATYTINFNDNYYFTRSGEIFTSNNKGINNSVAYTRLKIDATSRITNITAKVDYTISSESGYDFGYVTANNTAEFIAYNVAAGRFIYASGATTSSSSTTILTKGLVWYLHLGYRKDSGTHSNNDNFIISKITLT